MRVHVDTATIAVRCDTASHGGRYVACEYVVTTDGAPGREYRTCPKHLAFAVSAVCRDAVRETIFGVPDAP